jgi:hypothetical protein
MDQIKCWFHYIMSPEASSFWAMSQFLAVAISLTLIYRQIRLHRFSNMLNMISSIDTRWNSSNFLKHRQDICTRYNAGNLPINREESEVLGFFEDMGIFLKKGVFDADVIWDKYSYYIEHYWAMYEPHIKEFRTSHSDDTWYDKFQFLKNEMAKESKKRKLSNTEKTKAQISTFIGGELGGS